MDKRRLIISILAGIMALVMVLGLVASFIPTQASAASSSEIKKQIDALKEDKKAIQEEIQKLKGQINENQSEMEKMVQKKDLIDQEISLRYDEIANLNEQIAACSLLIADKQEELLEAEARFEELSDKNKERIRAMEEGGEINYWSVLFQANSFSDLLDRLNMVQEIAAADQRRLKELDAAAKEVAAAKTALEEEKAGLEVSKEELNTAQAELEAKRVEADEILADLVATGAEYEALMEESEDKQTALMKEIAGKEADYKAQKYKEWLATSVPPTTAPKPPSTTTKPSSSGGTAGTGSTVNGITWKKPMSYSQVSSPFGYRYHPISGKWKMHYGIDLAGPTGRPIYATRGGTVSYTGYEAGGAGNWVQINHGDGFKSVYMHMTKYVVRTGQNVAQGDLIGYCGSTGGSTGPHLHFGISYNGTYVNPANYMRF